MANSKGQYRPGTSLANGMHDSAVDDDQSEFRIRSETGPLGKQNGKLVSGKVPSEQTISGFWGRNLNHQRVLVAWKMGPGAESIPLTTKRDVRQEREAGQGC